VSFVTVFDVAQSGREDWTFFSFAAVFLLVVAIIWIKDLAIGAGWFRKIFGGLFVALGAFLTFMAATNTQSAAVALQELQQDGKYLVVEGIVQNFHPMPYEGHDTERFDVAGVRFEYSDYMITGGFNQTRSHGGPIRPGRYVRLTYVPRGKSGNVIIRVEVPRNAN
jgi:hypothetical protein